MNFEHKNLMKNILIKCFILNLISFSILTKIISYSFTYLNNNIIKDLEENWNLNPIFNINFSSIQNNLFKKPKKNIDFLGAFKKINKNLIKSNLIPNKYLTNDLYFNKWETKNFILNRTKNYQYKKLFINKKNVTKICGTDNNGNNLYFPINENCPINFIEITNEKKPSLNFSYYETIYLNNNKYLHYSNQNIKGKIVVQLRVGGNIKNYKNNLCLEKDSSIFNFNFIIENLLSIKNKFNCHFDNRYYELDEMNLTDFLIDNDFNIYNNNNNNNNDYIKTFNDIKYKLYYRSFIGVKSLNKNIEFLDQFLLLKRIIKNLIILNSILFIIILFSHIYDLYIFSKNKYIHLFINIISILIIKFIIVVSFLFILLFNLIMRLKCNSVFIENIRKIFRYDNIFFIVFSLIFIMLNIISIYYKIFIVKYLLSNFRMSAQIKSKLIQLYFKYELIIIYTAIIIFYFNLMILLNYFIANINKENIKNFFKKIYKKINLNMF